MPEALRSTASVERDPLIAGCAGRRRETDVAEWRSGSALMGMQVGDEVAFRVCSTMLWCGICGGQFNSTRGVLRGVRDAVVVAIHAD